jgi:hypothetical protein
MVGDSRRWAVRMSRWRRVPGWTIVAGRAQRGLPPTSSAVYLSQAGAMTARADLGGLAIATIHTPTPARPDPDERGPRALMLYLIIASVLASKKWMRSGTKASRIFS